MPARAKILAFGWCALAAATVSAPVSHAAEYPEKPIRWVVPWPPGGGVDITTRNLSPALAEALGGASFIVENRPGASAMIGTAFVAKAPPDEFKNFRATDFARWGEIVRKANIKFEP